MEFTKEKLISIVAATTVAIILGLYLFLYNPLIGKLKVAYLECENIEAEVLQARNSTAFLKTIGAKKGPIAEEDIALAIGELTREGRLKGIDFISMTSKKIGKKEMLYKILPIEIETESTYKEFGVLLGLLGDLEKSLITVKSFNMKSYKEAPAKLKTKLVVNMYISGEESAE